MEYKGFNYNGKTYVIHNNKIYRLPYKVGVKHFGLLECKKWGDGYILGDVRKSGRQIKGMLKILKVDFHFV